MKNANHINGGSRIGKGEVQSSILCGSTKWKQQQVADFIDLVCRANLSEWQVIDFANLHFDTQQSANTTSGYGRELVALFPRRSGRVGG